MRRVCAEQRGAGSHWQLTGKQISDLRLKDFVELLDSIPKYVRGISLCLRSMYSTSTAYVESFTSLQEDFKQDAMVFRVFLVPLVIEVLNQMQRLVANYLEDSCDVWQRKIDDSARAVKEFKILFQCLGEFFSHIGKDLAKYHPQVKEVRRVLAQETLKFEREGGAVAIRCLVQDQVFVALLFVPEVDYFAAPLVHGGAKHMFAKPAVASDEFERAVAAATTITDTLIPIVHRLESVFAEILVFFEDFLAEFEDELGASSDPPPPVEKRDFWADFGKSQEEKEAERKAEEEKAELLAGPKLTPEEEAARTEMRVRHYSILLPKCHWVQRSIMEMMQIRGSIISDMDVVPDAEPKEYPFEWLETRKNTAGEDIIDLARDATQNVEIRGALDPG